MSESQVVMAVGMAAISRNRGRKYSQRLERAMANAVLQCNAEGISTEEKNTPIIRARMQAAKEREKEIIFIEEGNAVRAAEARKPKRKWWLDNPIVKWVNRSMVK